MKKKNEFDLDFMHHENCRIELYKVRVKFI